MMFRKLYALTLSLLVLTAVHAQTLPVENYITLRGGLTNFYKTIQKEHKATAAFLGGSITFNPGWRDKVCEYLKERFPKTSFHFINAGIPSLGSLPHAFRLQQDVLDSGKIDLLFLESAVNDRGNGTDSITQVRALEGIVRHVKKSNPLTDIIFMSFADPPKTKDYNNSIIPAEIFNHELVANHYHLPSINLAKEVSDKINNKEFSWENDFKDLHPSPFGQELYFQAIKKLLDTCAQRWKLQNKILSKITLPAPLNKASFDNGKYVTVANAQHDDNWQLIENWTPADSLTTRPGFVNVAVLESGKPNAALSFSFKGNAVGIALLSGADAGMISYAIDNAAYKKAELYTQWSGWLHLPWYILLGSDLTRENHVLHIKINDEKNKASRGNACRIVHFFVND